MTYDINMDDEPARPKASAVRDMSKVKPLSVEEAADLAGVELVDITGDYEAMRAYKSDWERENMLKAVGLCDLAYDAMRAIAMAT